jgi:hemerythrin-like domain-containing protein
MLRFMGSSAETRARTTRRNFLVVAGASAAGLGLAACKQKTEHGDEGEEVGAVEDLMREHGVIRRALVVFREAATRLRGGVSSGAPSVAPEPLQATAALIRRFAEDYHEKLEELHVFPAVKKHGGAAAREIDALVAQHQRGREITDYVVGMTRAPIAADAAPELASALDAFARMYELHAAHEDTITFVAWKAALPRRERERIGDIFEQVEKNTFGKDGFEDAVGKIRDIERALGIDLDAFTPALAQAT